jgi:hypothetical protein
VFVLFQQKSESKQQDTKEANTASGIKMGRINRAKGDVGGEDEKFEVILNMFPVVSITRVGSHQHFRKSIWKSCVTEFKRCAEAQIRWAGLW